MTKFFDIKKDADPELIALAKDIKKQDSLSHFLTKFVKKNGYPVWDKVNYQTKINNQVIVYSNSTKSNDDVKLSTGVFLIPCVDEKAKQVKSYIVAKKLKADTYSYQLYNREELTKVHVPDSLKLALIGTQTVFGYFEKEINNINQINITNPTNKSIKNFYLKFIEQPQNKKKVSTNGVSIQESICKTATYYIQVPVYTTIGSYTEIWEVTVRQCEEIPSSGSGNGSTFPSNGLGGLGGTYPTSDPNNPFNPFYAPSPYSLNVPISSGEFLIQKLLITDVYQQGFLRNYLEISAELLRYLTINGFTQENEDFIRWAIGYLYGNPSVSFEELLNNRTDFDNETGDLDNNTIGGYDLTQYSDFDAQQDWTTIPNVIPKSQFVGWNRSLHPTWECMQYATEQIRRVGYQKSDYVATGQTFQVYTEQNGVNQTKLAQGLSYLKYALSNGIPVIVGVDNKPGHPGNLDYTTDHFIVIVGMGTDTNGRKYFSFYDNASGIPDKGAHQNNRLYYNSSTGLISGTSEATPYATGKIYTITMIRKSKTL